MKVVLDGSVPKFGVVIFRVGPGVWVAQARHNFSCPLIINIKKYHKSSKFFFMQNKCYIMFLA